MLKAAHFLAFTPSLVLVIKCFKPSAFCCVPHPLAHWWFHSMYTYYFPQNLLRNLMLSVYFHPLVFLPSSLLVSLLTLYHKYILRAISAPSNTSDSILIASQPVDGVDPQIPFSVYFLEILFVPNIINLVPWKTDSETLIFVCKCMCVGVEGRGGGITAWFKL